MPSYQWLGDYQLLLEITSQYQMVCSKGPVLEDAVLVVAVETILLSATLFIHNNWTRPATSYYKFY